MFDPMFELVFGESNIIVRREGCKKCDGRVCSYCEDYGNVPKVVIEWGNPHSSVVVEENKARSTMVYPTTQDARTPVRIMSEHNPDRCIGINLAPVEAIHQEPSLPYTIADHLRNVHGPNYLDLLKGPTSVLNYDPKTGKFTSVEDNQDSFRIINTKLSERLRELTKLGINQQYGRSKPTSPGGVMYGPWGMPKVFSQSTEVDYNKWCEDNPKANIQDYIDHLCSKAFSDTMTVEEFLKDNQRLMITHSPNDPDPLQYGTEEELLAARKEQLKQTKEVRKYLIGTLDEWWDNLTKRPEFHGDMDINRILLAQDCYKVYRRFVKHQLKKSIDVTDTIDNIRIDQAEWHTWAFLGKDVNGEWIRPISVTCDMDGNFSVKEDYEAPE